MAIPNKYITEHVNDVLARCENELLRALDVVRAAQVVAAYPDPTQQLAATVKMLALSASNRADMIVDADTSDVAMVSITDPVVLVP